MLSPLARSVEFTRRTVCFAGRVSDGASAVTDWMLLKGVSGSRVRVRGDGVEHRLGVRRVGSG